MRDQLWFGKRVLEIMEFKGWSYDKLTEEVNHVSMEQCGKKFGGKSTLFRVVKGERPVTKISELAIFATAFGITTDHLLQTNTESLEIVNTNLQKGEKLAETHALLKHWVNVAVSATEKCEALFLYARCLRLLELYENGYDALQEAIVCAKKHFIGREFMYKVHDAMSLMCMGLGDLDKFAANVREAERYLNGDPVLLARFLYLQAAYAHNQGDGDRRQYYKYLRQSLNVFRSIEKSTPDIRSCIGRLLNNFGDLRYNSGQYRSALIMFLHAEKLMVDDNRLYNCLLAKGIIKCYLALGEKEKAIERIERAMPNIEELDNPNVHARYLMLYAILKRDKEVAQKAASLDGLTEKLYYCAYRTLLYISLCLDGDVEKLEYFNKAMSYSAASAKENKLNFFEEDWNLS